VRRKHAALRNLPYFVGGDLDSRDAPEIRDLRKAGVKIRVPHEPFVVQPDIRKGKHARRRTQYQSVLLIDFVERGHALIIHDTPFHFRQK